MKWSRALTRPERFDGAHGAAEPVDGPEIDGVIENLRYRLFRFSLLGALTLVAPAMALSCLASSLNVGDVILAGAVMSAPLLVASRRPRRTWDVVSRHPALTLLIGPLNAVAGLLADRSAFLYPSLAWMGVAVVAGGLWWGLATAATLTAATTTAAVLDGEVIHDVLVKLPPGLVSRLLYAIALAALAEGLGQIVWTRALASIPRSARPPDAPPHSTGRQDHGPSPEPPDAEVVVDRGVVDEAGSPTNAPRPADSDMARSARKLSVREKEVIALLAYGLTLAQAADALGITYRAARWRTDRARDRINAKTTPELVRWAIEHGCVPRP